MSQLATTSKVIDQQTIDDSGSSTNVYPCYNKDTYTGTHRLYTASTSNVVCNGAINAISGDSKIPISSIVYSVYGEYGSVKAQTAFKLLLIPTGNSYTNNTLISNPSTFIINLKKEGGYVIFDDSIGYVTGGSNSSISKKQTLSYGSHSFDKSYFSKVTIKEGKYQLWYLIGCSVTAETETTSTDSTFLPNCDISYVSVSASIGAITVNTFSIEKGTKIFTNGIGYKEASDNYAVVMTTGDTNAESLELKAVSTSGTSATTLNANSKGCSISISAGSSSNALAEGITAQMSGSSMGVTRHINKYDYSFTMFPVLACALIPSATTSSTLFKSATTYSQCGCDVYYCWSGKGNCVIELRRSGDTTGAITLTNKPIFLTAFNNVAAASATTSICGCGYGFYPTGSSLDTYNERRIYVHPYYHLTNDNTHYSSYQSFSIMIMNV